jgi:hypothetical protein
MGHLDKPHSKRRMLLFDVGCNLYQINFNKKENGLQKDIGYLARAFTFGLIILLTKFS